MEKLSDENKSRLERATDKRSRKAFKRAEKEISEIKPTGTEKAPSFSRISKGRKKLWNRQYMQHRKSGVIVKVEVKE